MGIYQMRSREVPFVCDALLYTHLDKQVHPGYVLCTESHCDHSCVPSAKKQALNSHHSQSKAITCRQVNCHKLLLPQKVHNAR